MKLTDYIGSLHYVIILLCVTGTLILIFDTKIYKKAGMNKERKAARFLGWLNLSLSALVLSIHWIFQEWLIFR